MLLDYYIRVIKKDMEADNLSFMIYPESNKSGQKNNIPKPPLFSHYYNSEKDKIIRMNESEIIEFDDVSTNGVKWVHRFFDEHEICYDFRMSLIYTLAKLKYYYENHNNRLFYDKYIMIESDDSLKIH
ncbi:hypothetical protein SAMN02910447_03330 [Ruminococcus sp. YE71]|nr:hypothetical protein SAMN02910446_03399 [Ruminococcus sp. YE78]SFW51005.1 hypothetical protein SAMN02910447_03330 [Ruminococcus sp. YE71]